MNEPLRYLIVIEGGEGAYSAWVPDIPGCVGAAASREELISLMHGALEFHLEGMREDGDEPPPPASSSAYVEVRVAA